MIDCVVVDDEPLARASIEALISTRPDFTLRSSIGDARRALSEAVAAPPDVLFLDIRMPGISGLELLKELRRRVPEDDRPYVILVTACDRHALQAFEYEALDYLVKPFDNARFLQSLARARRGLELRRQYREARTVVQSSDLTVSSGGDVLRLDATRIAWIEAADHYVLIHLEGRTHLIRETLGEMERQLAARGFARVHRGALVNLELVVETRSSADGGRELSLRDGSTVPVSRRRWSELREALTGR